MDKIFIINHLGGEYLSVNVSGLKNDSEALWEIMRDMFVWIRKPSIAKNIGFHIYDTEITKQKADRITKEIGMHGDDIFRFSFIGLKRGAEMRMRRYARRNNLNINVSYFFNVDKAKDWLVGKRISG